MIAAYAAADLLDDVPDLKPMMSIINQDMTQPLLARDVVRFVGEPVAVVVTEQPYQGEDAAELVDVDYDPLPVAVDMRTRPATMPSGCSPMSAPTWPPPSVTRPSSTRDLFDGCEVSGLHGRSKTSGSPPPRWRAAPPRRSGVRTGG